MKSLIFSGIFTGLLLPGLAVGQTTTKISEPAATSPTPPTTWVPNTLFKLGTGLSRQSGYGSSSGLRLPLTLGAEYQLRPAVSLYANLASVMALQRNDSIRYDAQRLSLAGLSADFGVRYYYGQAKRQRLGRAHGPFVGNYVAVQTGIDLSSYRYRNSFNTRRYYSYDYSHMALVWGMQRRIGQWGLFDGNAGLGLSSRRNSENRSPGLLLELNARISLAH